MPLIRIITLGLAWTTFACGAATLPATTSARQTGFYAQTLSDGGIPIRGSAKVTPRGLAAARDRLELLLGRAPRLRRNLEAARYELHVMGLEEFPSDLPEYRGDKGTTLASGQLFDWHMIGGHISESAGHFSSCAEGTLLPIVGHRLFGDETCIHELAHAIDWFALDSATRARLVVEFRQSTESGHWHGQYAATNEHEWFAEVTKYYFRRDRDDLASYAPSLKNGHDWLCAYDPRACQLVADLYEDRIDPGAPKTVTLAPSPASLEATAKSREARVPVRVVVRNRTSAPLHVVWIDYDGKRDARRPFRDQPSASPTEERALFTFATHAFVVTDDSERALCTFVAPEEEAIVDVTGSCP